MHESRADIDLTAEAGERFFFFLNNLIPAQPGVPFGCFLFTEC